MNTQYQIDKVMRGLNIITVAAKGITCDLLVMQEDGATLLDPYSNDTRRITLEHPEFTFDTNGNRLLPGDTYVAATCRDGYRYYMNVSGNSIMAIAAEVLGYLQYK